MKYIQIVQCKIGKYKIETFISDIDRMMKGIKRRKINRREKVRKRRGKRETKKEGK